MRTTARLLIRIQPLHGDRLTGTVLRLSPAARAQSESGQQTKAKRTDRQTFNETIRGLINQKGVAAPAQASQEQATTTAARSETTLPPNLRLEVADKKKTMFWKVSREQRQEMRKILREA